MDRIHEDYQKVKHLLSPVQQMVMKYRFGIDGSPVYEVGEIVRELRMSLEEVRLLEADAMAKIKDLKNA